MCGTSPAAEVGNIHQLQPPANNAPPTRHSSFQTNPPQTAARDFFFSCCCCFCCSLQWNEPLLSVSVNVFALSLCWFIVTALWQDDWRLNANLPTLFFRCFPWCWSSFMLLACVSILHVCLCCCACRPPLPLLSSDQDGFLFFLLSFRSLTIGRAPCNDVSWGSPSVNHNTSHHFNI